VDLKHFFDGQQSRENASSAFLATVLEHDEAFRREFLALTPASPPLDDARPWTVRVEDTRIGWGSMDITLESDSTVILIENKIAASAKQKGQLLGYYGRALNTWPAKRIIAIYLAPTTSLGEDEVAAVQESLEFRSRPARPPGPDAAGTIAWGDIAAIIEALPEHWFATTGIRAVLKAIDKAATPMSDDAQRQVVRRVTQGARVSLAAKIPSLRLGRWPTRTTEEIYTVKAPVSLFLTVVFDVEPKPSDRLRDVVVDGRVRLTVRTVFMLSGTGRKSPALVAEWIKLVAAGSVDIEGVGVHLLEGGKRFEHSQAWTGTKQELEDFLIETGVRMMDFLRPYLSIPAISD
jgi:hypothetical protein